MSAHVVLSCEGRPSYGRCIATMHSGTQHTPTARANARAVGWVRSELPTRLRLLVDGRTGQTVPTTS